MAFCRQRLAQALSLGFLTMFLLAAGVSTECSCGNQPRGRADQWRQQLRSCDDYMRHGRRGQGGCARRQVGFFYGDQPSQQCCQSLQRISSEDRCRALREVYGGMRQQDANAVDDVRTSTTQMASHLLQQCDLRPRDCSRTLSLLDRDYMTADIQLSEYEW